MALSLTVRMGGGTASGTADYSDQWRIFGPNGERMFDAGNAFDNGGSTQWQFVIDDDDNEIPSVGTAQLAAHNLVTVIDDAPGFDAWVGRGRISNKQQYRGDVQMGDAIQWSVTVDDANTHLKGLALVTPWVRSSESGRARVLALIAAFLQGDPRLTTNLDDDLVASGGEVTMPAKTYPAGTELAEILDDCATVEGKVYGVVIHHVDSVSHECLMYIDEADHTTYLSTLTITDDEPDLSTEFPPIWDQGPAALHDGQELTSHLISSYGAGTASFTVAKDTTRVDSYDYWAVPYNDSESETSAQAVTRAAQILEERSVEHVTHQATIKLPADKIHLVEAGMSIKMQAAASMGGLYLDTLQTRRIAQCKKEPIAPEVGEVVGQYLVHLQLDRPVRVFGAKKGLPVGPKPPSSGTSPLYERGDGQAGASVQTAFSETIREDESILVFVSHEADLEGTPATPDVVWQPTAGGDPEALSPITEWLPFGNDFHSDYMRAWFLENPTPGAGEIACNTPAKTLWGYSIISDANGTPTVDTTTGTGGTASINASVASGSLLVGLQTSEKHNSTGGPGTVSSATGETESWRFQEGTAFNDTRPEAIVSYKTADATSETFTSTLPESREWGYIVCEFAGTAADTTEPIGDSGDPGTDGTYAPIDHVHAHGTFASGDYHTEYQKESEKAAASGYASLDSSTKVPIAQIPTGTTSTTVSLGNHTHEGGGGSGSSVLPLGMPYGTLDRSYTFDSDTESWTKDLGTLSQESGWLRLVHTTVAIALEPDVGDIANGEVQADIRIVTASAPVTVVPLVFRAADANNLYLFEYQPASRAVALYKRVSGTFTSLGSIATIPTYTVQTDLIQKWMARFNGSQIEAYVNNTLVGMWKDTTHTTGRIGMGVNAETMEVDNVRVYSITTETQASPGTGARV